MTHIGLSRKHGDGVKAENDYGDGRYPLNDLSTAFEFRKFPNQCRTSVVADHDGENNDGANGHRYLERQRKQHKRHHGGRTLRPREAQHRDCEGAGQQPDPRRQGVAAITPAASSSALHEHDDAREHDQTATQKCEGRRTAAQEIWRLAHDKTKHKENREA